MATRKRPRKSEPFGPSARETAHRRQLRRIARLNTWNRNARVRRRFGIK